MDTADGLSIKWTVTLKFPSIDLWRKESRLKDSNANKKSELAETLRSSLWLVKCDCVVIRGQKQCRGESWHYSTVCGCEVEENILISDQTSEPCVCCPTRPRQREEKGKGASWRQQQICVFWVHLCAERRKSFWPHMRVSVSIISPLKHIVCTSSSTSKWTVPARTCLIINAV